MSYIYAIVHYYLLQLCLFIISFIIEGKMSSLIEDRLNVRSILPLVAVRNIILLFKILLLRRTCIQDKVYVRV